MVRIDFRRTLAVILMIALSSAFLVAGLTKFSSRSAWSERFDEWGYASWFVPVIGALETAGAVTLWVRPLRRHAIALLMVIMVGAIYTNATNQPRAAAIRPIVFLLILTGLAALERRRRAQPRAVEP